MLMKFHQHVYEQLLLSKISKAQKDSHVISVFAFWGFGNVKALILVKFDHGGLVLRSSLFLKPHHLPLKMILASKVVKRDSKNNLASVAHSVGTHAHTHTHTHTQTKTLTVCVSSIQTSST